MDEGQPEGVIYGSRRFHLDEDVLPGTGFGAPGPCLNNGKQVARNRAGRWICCFTLDRSGRPLPVRSPGNWALYLAVSDDACTQGSAFPDPIVLVGKGDALFPFDGGGPGNVSLVLDEADRLHVVFEEQGEIYRLSADAAGESPRVNLCAVDNWTGPDRICNEGGQLGDVTLDGSGRCVVYYTHRRTLYEHTVGEVPRPVCDNAAHPSIHTEPSGTTHLAFERDRRIYYLRREKGSSSWTDSAGNDEEEMVAYFCSSWPSIAAAADGKVVIAYQGEGKTDLKRFPPLYSALRAAGGSTVSYALNDGTGWSVRDYLRSSEILLKRRPHHRHPQVDPTFAPFVEEFWRPSLTVDRHGLIWMFYVNTTRRHVYWCRFQGETFGAHHEARGPYDVMSRTMFLQKDTRGQDEIAYLTMASHQVYFDAVPVPSYSSVEERRVVFLDNLEVDQMVGLEHEIGMWEKHPEPVYGWGITGNGEDDNVAWCRVYPRADGFEMHYMGQGRELRNNHMPGRAFSSDGVHWEKRAPAVDDPTLTLDGKPMPSSFWRPIYLEDAEEGDPDRRFKGLIGRYRVEQGIELRVWDVIASPDERAWHTVEGLPTVVGGDISICSHLVRDEEDRDPARRYKFLAVTGCSAGRVMVLYTSPDLIHWDKANYLREDTDDLLSPLCPYPTGPIAIDPDAAESPWEEEVHDAYIWREHGIMMFHYDAFYFGANQHIDKALAISRDGRHFWRVKRGAIDMPHGNCGEWDSGRNRTGIPLRVGDELWMYFCGMPAQFFGDCDEEGYVPPLWVDAWSYEKTSLRQEQRPWRVGMARLRVDGWAYVQLAREAERGQLTTIPFAYMGGELVVNGSGLGTDGIRVEVLEAESGAVVAGHEKEKCRFSASDAVTSRVGWSRAKPLQNGSYRLRFVFEGLRAKLYAFGFET